jgi:CelD/BcsL family acetyltransferase involved in cellulose biosynthesis
MLLRPITTAAELERLAGSWNALAGGIPFRRHEWLVAWWSHYGQGRQLCALCLEEAGGLVAVAPFYRQRSVSQGRVLRLLGDGEVCSDYLGLLTTPERAPQAAAAVADWLCRVAGDREFGWDALELDGVDSQDAVTARVVEELSARRCQVHRRTGPQCWRLELPADWVAYEASLSKSHRKQVRRLIDRVFDRGRARLHTVSDAGQLEHGRQILIDLHQRRRQALGEPGCFSSPPFAAFHEEVVPRLFAAGLLRLHWLELDGVPAAAEYHLAEGGVIYGYQSGVAPELLDEEPGRLSAIATLRLAIEERFAAFDFLRGDEPYKAHFRAQPRPLVQYRIAPPRTAARLRHGAWSAREAVKDWWRAGRQDAKRVDAGTAASV